ncbi:putative serine/threonine-protein kinase CPE1738 [Camellia lanceoleosa]|uniref:Serine/threonine-protein kinase CPE1738 n=1 Tax=Camellia lanceoleosa TaxID=1840588 RepID=A0ACC0FAS5_9ERIC|nr:putative serine/threonine-protein kinase CPE1738 [Camellia lanceoleosa]
MVLIMRSLRSRKVSLAMETVIQRTYHQKIKQQTGLFSDSEETQMETHPLAYTNGCEVCRDLDCVHSSGYVHRALQPDNIIIVPVSTSTRTETEYVAKNGDFGLANAEKQMMTTSKSYKLRGNIRYLSPETVVDRGLQQETPSSNV